MMLKLSPHVIPETDTRPHFRGNKLKQELLA